MKPFRNLWPALFLLLMVFLPGWGFLVHRTVHQVAVYRLPDGLRPFFYAHRDYLVAQSVRPDQRRNSDPSEGSRHFIDTEPYGDSSLWKMPFSWNEAVARYSRDSLEKYGYVPYWVMVMKDRLTGAFRKGDRDSILFYAADLGHYIADAHVPLHTTINYDGQLTGQKGLHSLWESTVPEIAIDGYQLHSRHKARYRKDADAAIWSAARSAYALLPGVLETEKEVSRDFTEATKYRVQVRNGKEVRSFSSEFAKAYSRRLSPSINRQLLRSSELIADFWYTCWVDAGRPNLQPLQTKAYDAAAYKKEYKAWRKNDLVQKGWLLSRKREGAASE
ncbi:MAG TPA: zinc dependent phospholipase C family protein [Chitinophagaceae bacterium]|nr:zinc dependent phospholipase C family protein [Chitinophagaceae bacterium]